ncbi:exodeoxyribonuclease VII large subunit [Paenibacillus sp. CFBP13512]|uniref:exodeoxyribonuclease VII large subunit n=1 Tax=Paenibacillus sp. CFBP13512 TaxID=2184007 RepID=UPI0010C123D6|nr:exodeoxyribonuclease VII large subunit [Paenibacillus sp. CFBP13512]TKJ94100.1 exodeoxyribonuclease VII large subunit [Paenibacillus sp. CFBP13512]
MQQQKVYSIKEINKYIRMKMESDQLLSEVWLRGEISNFTHHSSGHMYFTLKDESSRIKTIMFASHNQRLPFIPKEGARVMAKGNISVFERDGQYQFYVTQMQPDGIGSLYLAYEQLKQKLEHEGLFDHGRKRPLPAFPKVIGVITSGTGAAVRDILTTIRRRYPIVKIEVYPVLVQGKGAGSSVVKAIQNFNRMQEADVLIVGRGGGSLEELWAFNEEIVARAIASSKIPIISAVGHETDFTIADFVADLRAATPTAAAELAVPNINELRAQVEQRRRQLNQGLLRLSQRQRERLERLRRAPVLLHPQRHLVQHMTRLDMLERRLTSSLQRRAHMQRDRLGRFNQRLARHNPQEQLIYARRRTDTARQQLELRMSSILRQKQQKLGFGMKQLDALSPLKVMARGYSLVYDEQEQQLVKSVQQVQQGDHIIVNVEDGQLNCQVTEIKEAATDGKS